MITPSSNIGSSFAPAKQRIPIASTSLRKLLFTFHLFAAVGWIGAIVAYIAVNVAALTSSNDTIVRGAFLILKPMLIYAITPLAVTALMTGIVLALVTPWGLLRHRWVVASLWLTGIAVVLLVAHINGDDIAELTAIAKDTSEPAHSNLGDLPNAIGGLFLVSIAFVLNVYKPRSLTKRGKRWQEVRAKNGTRFEP